MTAQTKQDDQSRRRRRSIASATAPPYRPKTISGIKPASPFSPTQSDEPVIAYTWTATAMAVTWKPRNETPWPTKSRRKS